MNPIRPLARVMLSGIFIDAGIGAFRDPESKTGVAAPIIERIGRLVPGPAPDPALLVQANAALQVAAGTTLALGVLPRLSALALAGSLVPTTLGGHRFWEIDDPVRRGQQRIQFLKNAAILGGLITMAVDR